MFICSYVIVARLSRAGCKCFLGVLTDELKLCRHIVS